MFKYETLDYLQSIVKAEWNIVRTCQTMLLPDLGAKVLPQEFCGVLFMDNFAYAGSGHFIIRIKLQSDYPVQTPFFFDFNKDDVIEGFNPYGEHLPNVVNLFSEWKVYSSKVNPQEIIQFSDEHIQTLRERRLWHLQLSPYVNSDNNYTCRLYLCKGDQQFMGNIPMRCTGCTALPFFPVTTLSLTYVYKIMDFMKEWYHLVELGTNSSVDNSILIKGKNPHSDKPDIRVLLGKYVV